jgi:hypothetical protein
MESATPVVPPVVAAPAKSAARDSVVISSGGMRIELTDAQEYTAHGAADGCDQETRRKLSQGICSRYSMSPSRR